MSSERMSDVLFVHLLKQLGLTDMAAYIKANNPVGNEYHNTEHMFGVAKLAAQIYLTENLGCFDQQDLFQLVSAALWHDFGHSGGALSDRENIEIAIAALRAFVKLPEANQFNDYSLQFSASHPALLICSMIRVTEFPFIHEPTDQCESILRDADVLYSFGGDPGEILYNLYKELKGAGKLPEEMTFPELVKGQQSFHDSLVIFTDTGKAIFDSMRAEVVEAQNSMARDLFGPKPGDGVTVKLTHDFKTR